MHVIKGSNERNIDDWVTASYPGGSHALLNRSHDSDPDLGSGQFVREVGIRRRSSIDGVRRKTSLSPPRWIWLIFYSVILVYSWLQGGGVTTYTITMVTV